MLSVLNLRLIETSDDETWSLHAKRQWGNGRISVRLSAGGSTLGISPPQEFRYRSLMLSLEGLLVVPIHSALAQPLLLEVVSYGGGSSEPKGHVVALASFDFAAFFATGARFLRHSLHVFPTQALNDTSVHAVMDVEILGAGVDAAPAPAMPMDFSCGAVRASVLDLYFPSLLTASQDGTHLVSNVVCVGNATETRALVVRMSSASAVLRPYPDEDIRLMPGQKCFLSVTWYAFALAAAGQAGVPGSQLTPAAAAGGGSSGGVGHALELTVTDAATGDAYAPVAFHVHNYPPQGVACMRPYQYWVNTAQLTNHQIPAADMPFVRSVLPVFLLQLVGQEATTGLARDMDSGGVVTMGDGRATFSFGMSTLASSPVRSPAAAFLPSVDVTTMECEVRLHLGVLKGLPPPSEFDENTPGFKVIVSPLHEAWNVKPGAAETSLSYQAVSSGALRWEAPLLLYKRPCAANARPFARLTLVEVAAVDGDETPIGTAMMTLWPQSRTALDRPATIGFSLFDSFSKYDRLMSPAAVCKGARWTITPRTSTA